MAGDYIIELSKAPVPQDERMTESEFYDSYLLGSIADYFSDDVDRELQKGYFFQSMKQYGAIIGEDCITFPKGFRERYFEERLKQLKNLVKNITIEQFSSDGMDEYNIRSLVQDKFDTYIQIESGLNCLDSFVRSSQEDTLFYLGGIVYYHH